MHAHSTPAALGTRSLVGMLGGARWCSAEEPHKPGCADGIADVAKAACLYAVSNYMALIQMAGDAYRSLVNGPTRFGGFASLATKASAQYLMA